VLIEDGILKGYMQDRLNARLMGVAPTGNGRRESYAHAPMPRMTNTFMKGGNDDPGRTAEPREERHLRQELWRRAGRYRLGQVRVFLHRGLSGENGKLGARSRARR
jgi:TldD protein